MSSEVIRGTAEMVLGFDDSWKRAISHHLCGLTKGK
uniref:Asparaginyl-tRNA synthetase 1 n=1 Tax=Mus musculus TaxID=10090 RepID=A0A494BB81_MOUSE